MRKYMIYYMNYSRHKANVRHPRSIWAGLEEDRIIFAQFIKNIKKAKFIIVYIYEWSLNLSALPLYIWMKKGEDGSIMIEDSNARFNCSQ